MAATPTRLEKTRARVFIPPRYRTRSRVHCYTPPPDPPPGGGGGGSGGGSGGESCRIVIVRTVTPSEGGSVSWNSAAGEFLLRKTFNTATGVFTFTIARRVCT